MAVILLLDKGAMFSQSIALLPWSIILTWFFTRADLRFLKRKICFHSFCEAGSCSKSLQLFGNAL
ncbi:MAG TPA: hypothetical protein DCS30_01535 [Rhizobiales bacterium]|nr:hypothetical protein [Hyphomicrobiales bacterium]